MQVTGMLYGSKLLQFAGFPTSEVLGPDASEEAIKALIDRHGSVFIKPLFKGGVGKKGKAGLLGRAKDLKSALKEKERLYFVEHRHGNQTAKANGVTFEGAVPAEHEVYFSITDSTRFRAPTMTLTHHGGMDIEELDKALVANVPFDPLTGLKAFVVANALSELNAPKQIISPLVQQLPKLWELYHNFGMTTLELNPIRMRPDRQGRLTPVACDFKCGFDRDDPRWQRLDLPAHLFAVDHSDFEQEINQLRTYQGQSDVYVINAAGTILAPTFGGGANSLVTEMLGDDAIISSDFGGNPPYEKMKEVARICFKHWLRQANVLFIIGGKSNNTDIFETFRAMADALREHFSERGPTPLYVVIGRGGPNLVRGMAAMRDTMEALGLPYRIFGFDSDMSEVVNYAKTVNNWMKNGGREQVATRLGVTRRPREPRRRRQSAAIAQADQGFGGSDVQARRWRLQVLRRHQLARGDRHPQGSRVRAQHPWRRVQRGDTRRPRVFGRQRGVRHLTGTARAGSGNEDRRHPRLQQRARGLGRRPPLQLRRRLPAAAGSTRWRGRAHPAQPGARQDLHRHREDIGARRAGDPRDGPSQRRRCLRRQLSRGRRRLEQGSHRWSAGRRYAW